MKKRILSVFLTLAITMTSVQIPVSAYAEESVDEIIDSIEDEIQLENVDEFIEENVDTAEEVEDYVEEDEESSEEEIVVYAAGEEDEESSEEEIVVYAAGEEDVLGDLAEIGSGTCGTSATYRILDLGDGSGYKLVIEGTGAVANYSTSAALTTAPWNAYAADIVEIYVSDDITSIGSFDFYGMNSIKKVYIGLGVNYIGNQSFSGCSGINDLTIPASVNVYCLKSSSSYNYSFDGCTGIKKLHITAGYASGKMVAYTKTSPSSTTSTCTYYYARPWHNSISKITSLIIDDGVKSIGSYAFYGASNLSENFIGNTITELGSYAFYGCSSLESIVIPDAVSALGSYAFYNCSSLRSIAIPEGVTSISSYLFYECSLLEEVNVGSALESVDSYAFYNCSSLEKCDLPDSVQRIYGYAFYGCSSLKNINIPNGVKSIIEYSFYRCTSLKELVIPDSVTVVGYEAFYGCSGITSLTVPATLATSAKKISSSYNYSFDGCNSITNLHITSGTTGKMINYDTTAPTADKSSCTYNYARPWFSSRTKLNNIVIDEGVTEIGSYSFSDCSTPSEIVLPSTIIRIGANAFYKCTRMSSIIIPESCVTLGNYCFYGCSLLNGVYLPEGIEEIPAYSFGQCIALDKIILPDTVNSIERDSFYGCTSLKECNIPDAVKIIGVEAFYGCSSIQSIRMNKVTTIGDKAFYNCSMLREAYMPSVVTVYDRAFYGCSAIKSLTIAATVTGTMSREGSNGNYTYYYPFQGCTGIETLHLTGTGSMKNYTTSKPQSSNWSTTAPTYYMTQPWYFSWAELSKIIIDDGISEIGCNAFNGCTNLQYIKMPITTAISNSSFTSAKISEVVISKGMGSAVDYTMTNYAYTPWYMSRAYLTKATIEDGVAEIGDYMFYNCTNLSSLVLPETIEHIGMSAFAGCSNVTDLTLPISTDISSSGSFEGMNKISKVTLTQGTGEGYDYTIANYSNTPWYISRNNNLNVSIVDGVTKIGDYTFYNCKGLNNLNITTSVTTIGTDAFKGTKYEGLSASGLGTKYTVTYNPNSGTISTVSKLVTYAAAYGSLVSATKKGYSFTGWYTSAVGGNKITENTIVVVADDHSVFAHWNPNKYTVEFNPNGGNVGTVNKQVTYDDIYGTLPTPTRNGYSFAGWYTDSKAGSAIENTTVVSVADNHTIYAHWVPNKYTVSFNPNSGAVAITDKEVTFDSEYGSLPIPTKMGYSPIGWYTDTEIGEKIDSTTVVSKYEDHTIYAHWVANEYTISFDPNGGSTPTSKMVVSFDSAYGNLPKPTKTGYGFLGWYTEEQGGICINGTDIVDVDDNQTLYAHWTKQFVVNFDVNGGEENVSPIEIINGENYGKLPQLTRYGYYFEGWFTEIDNGKKIEEDTVVDVVEDQILYAHWMAKEIQVSFDANGGACYTDKKNVNFDQCYGELPAPMLKGYNFDGWFSSSVGGTEIKEDTILTNAENHTLYAHWTIGVYEVIFSTEGGKPNPSGISVQYGDKYGKLPVVTREGYSFEGWYDAKDGGELIDSETLFLNGSDQILFAHWKPFVLKVGLVTEGGECDVNEVYVTFDECYGELPTPKRRGYDFVGWYYSGKKILCDSVVNIPDNHSLLAKWSASSYAVDFDANGGTVNYSEYRVIFGEKYGSLPTPVRPGLIFVGWYTEKNGGQKVTDSSIVEVAENHILYAKWAEVYVEETYDAKTGITWSLVDGELTVSFVRNLMDEYISSFPWERTGENKVTDMSEYITSVTIMEGAESIPVGMLWSMKNLKTLNISKSCVEIETLLEGDNPADAFVFCNNLQEINVTDGNKRYKSVEGVLFSADMTTLWFYPNDRRESLYIVPDSVISITNLYSNNLRELDLGVGTQTIEYGIGGKNIIEIRIQKNLSYLSGGEFDVSDKFQRLIIDPNNRYFSEKEGELLSKDAKVLYQVLPSVESDYCISDSVREIAANAFKFNNYFTSITIPKGVKTIGASSFYAMKKIRRVNLLSSDVSFGGNPYSFSSVSKSEDGEFYVPTRMAKNSVEESLKEVGATEVEVIVDNSLLTKYQDDNTQYITLTESTGSAMVFVTNEIVFSLPKGGTSAIWKTNKAKIASIDPTGRMKAIRTGTVKVTASSGGRSYCCIVKIVKPQISSSKLTLNVSKQAMLEVKNIRYENITWKSSKTSVVSVDSFGNIKALKPGSAYITAKVGNVKLKSKIVVPKISMNYKKFIFTADKPNVRLKILQELDDEIDWSSSKPSVISVDDSGLVVPVAEKGSAVIKACVDNTIVKCKVSIDKRYNPIKKGSFSKFRDCIISNGTYSDGAYYWIYEQPTSGDGRTQTAFSYNPKDNTIVLMYVVYTSAYTLPHVFAEFWITPTGNSIDVSKMYMINAYSSGKKVTLGADFFLGKTTGDEVLNFKLVDGDVSSADLDVLKKNATKIYQFAWDSWNMKYKALVRNLDATLNDLVPNNTVVFSDEIMLDSDEADVIDDLPNIIGQGSDYIEENGLEIESLDNQIDELLMDNESNRLRSE